MHARHHIVFLLLCSFVGFGQAVPPPSAGTGDDGVPRAIDPMLVKPADQLTTAQITNMQKKLSDWAQLGRYHDENARLLPAPPDRVVFLGDSITDAWSHPNASQFFPGKPYVNRGIGGQTTGQMLVRFQQDVVALKPVAVVILGGINDIAGNNGEESLGVIEDNQTSMVAIARQSHIRVILSSVLPAIDFPWRPGLHPAEKVRELNAWMRPFAAAHGCIYLDYYAALADENGGMKPGISRDNVHPTPAGYAIMSPLAEAAIDRALRHPAP